MLENRGSGHVMHEITPTLVVKQDIRRLRWEGLVTWPRRPLKDTGWNKKDCFTKNEHNNIKKKYKIIYLWGKTHSAFFLHFVACALTIAFFFLSFFFFLVVVVVVWLLANGWLQLHDNKYGPCAQPNSPRLVHSLEHWRPSTYISYNNLPCSDFDYPEHVKRECGVGAVNEIIYARAFKRAPWQTLLNSVYKGQPSWWVGKTWTI